MVHTVILAKILRAAGLAVLMLALSACATQRPTGPINDPFESANRAIHKFNDRIDRYALKPVSTGYRNFTPSVVRSGVNNFFGNLGDVTTAVNSFLQGKVQQGLSDTARVAVNTVFGIGGLVDVATTMDLDKNYEDFGQTLGEWGVPEGPYIVLPFFGPQTLRGTVGLIGHAQIEPLNTLNMARDVRGGLVLLNVVNARANLLAASSLVDSGALDPYRFIRDRFVGYRRNQITYRELTQENPKKTSDSASDLDELDELDKLDELDELDLLDELDELDNLDELDELDELDDEGASDDAAPTGNADLDLLNELDALD